MNFVDLDGPHATNVESTAMQGARRAQNSSLFIRYIARQVLGEGRRNDEKINFQ